MMNANESYRDFLKKLRIAITNASVYFKEHPIFIKSVKDLKIKLDEILVLANSLEIGITYNALSLNNKLLERGETVEDIRNFFHRRKIQNITIQKGLRFEELSIFLIRVNLSPKDILIKGGLGNILAREKVIHIIIKDLDYSELLRSKDIDYKYSWLYVLRRSLEGKNFTQIRTLADSFQRVLDSLNLSESADIEEIKLIIEDFFTALRENDKERFSKCLISLAKSMLHTPNLSKVIDINHLKNLFNNLSSEDVSTVLFSQLRDIREVGSFHFELFAQFISRQKHQEAATSLAQKLEKAEWLKNTPQIIKRLHELFTIPASPYISKLYQRSLSSILKTVSLRGETVFDQSRLRNNYRLLLLDLLHLESNQRRLNIVIDKIFVELTEAINKGNQEYIDKFIEVFEGKRITDESLKPFFDEADKRLSEFLEDMVFRRDICFDFGNLIDIVHTSSHGLQFYFNQIFKEGKINVYISKLFFKLFPQEVDQFCENLHKYIGQVKFIKNVMGSLKNVEPSLSSKILKYIFNCSNDFIKLEVLRAMQALSLCEEEFLFSILRKPSFLHRKQAFLILVNNSQTRKRLAQQLLDISNPFGMRSKLIMENLALLSEVFFNEAKAYLAALSKYKFFWNKTIRTKAKEILNQYGS